MDASSLFDQSFFKGKKVLVTGHTGFKGSWLCRILLNAGADVTGYSLEPPTNPSLFELTKLKSHMNSIIGDVRDFDKLSSVVREVRPEIVMHLAAQPIVLDGYREPRYTYETNVMGTVNVLEAARLVGCVHSLLNVTTDKVYLNAERDNYGYKEDDPLDGWDPYSNSKSCSDIVTHSYYKSFLKVEECATSCARAGNVIGGGDFAPNRIIPDCVRAVESGEPLLIRNPASTRPYQHVLEPLFAYLLIVQKQWEIPEYADVYNVGPDDADCVTTGKLVELFANAWGSGFTFESAATCAEGSSAPAPHEANFLKLDSTKLKTTFGWSPRWNIEQAVKASVVWSRAYLSKEDICAVMDEQIKDYLKES